MKRSTIIIGIAMAILCIPTAQTVASALGLGVGSAGPAAPADFAASVYANVSDAACGYATDYDPAGGSYSTTAMCATADHARLTYRISDDSADAPVTESGSFLWVFTQSCELIGSGTGSYPSYQCDSDSFAGAIPRGAFSVDPLMATGSIRATVQTGEGRPCAIDFVLNTPDGPTAGNDQWSYADPSNFLSVSMGARVNAAAHRSGSLAGAACGRPLGPSSFAQVSRGAGLAVDVSASAAPSRS